MDAFVKVSGGKEWKKALRPYVKGNGIGVKIGIPENATYSGETAEAGTPVFPIAAAQEFGAPGIPQRSFIRSTVARRNKHWIALAVAWVKARPADFEGAFNVVGLEGAKDMQAAINAGIDPPSAPETIARKLKRGRKNPNTPLIDTGTLQESIDYEMLGGKNGR